MADTIPCGLLHSATLHLVKNRPRSLTLERIGKDTGISLSWLKTYSQGKSKHPSVSNVEALYTYLSGKKLVLEYAK